MGNALSFQEVPFAGAGGCENLCACLLCDLHGGLADAPCCRMNQHFVSWLQICQMLKAIVGRQKSEGQGRRFCKAELLWLGDDELGPGGDKAADAISEQGGNHLVANV